MVRSRLHAPSTGSEGNSFRIVTKALMPNLLCSITARWGGFYAIELTAPKLSGPRVTPWSRC